MIFVGLGVASPAAAQEAAPAAPAASAAECFPACRSGFTCHGGQCVSLCNPPCEAGERCMQNGECERAPSAERDEQRQSPPSIPDIEEPIDDEPIDEPAEALPRSNPILAAPGSWVFAARGGLQFVGRGHGETTCDSSGEVTCSRPNRTEDTSARSWVMLGLDGLIHVAPGLRLGLGYQLVPYSAISVESDSEVVHLGHEHALSAVIEGVLPLGRSVGLALRAQGGLRMLVIGGDLAEDGDRYLSACYDSNLQRCEVDQGPLFGHAFGAMLGVLGGGKVRWRVDLAVDRSSTPLPGYSTFGEDYSVSIERRLYETRSWVLGGFEL